jgi:hypothetical protein
MRYTVKQFDPSSRYSAHLVMIGNHTVARCDLLGDANLICVALNSFQANKQFDDTLARTRGKT